MLDLVKAKEDLKISLEKKGISTVPSADLAFVLDVSGSFHDEHVSGITQTLLERLVPWGMLFDPDQKLDVFSFSNGETYAHHVGDITPNTCTRYIQDKIINKVPGYSGGTDYSYVIEKVLQQFGWLPIETTTSQPTGGFLGRLMGKTKTVTTTTQNDQKRSIVLFITDGDNSDRYETKKILEESQKRGDLVYFLFIAVGTGSSFKFLKEIGDMFSNTGLVVVQDLKKFVAQSNDDLNNELIGSELITWLKK
jgi:hypothetical protein